jgi:hypothetical protein
MDNGYILYTVPFCVFALHTVRKKGREWTEIEKNEIDRICRICSSYDRVLLD